MTKPTCPYCRAPLLRFPQRKSRCPSCGQTIFVKKLPDDRRKHLMTAAQAEGAEALWRVYHDDRRIADFCRQWGIDEAKFRTEIGACSDVDAAFERHYQHVCEHDADLHQRFMAAHMLSIIEGKRGGDFRHWRRESARYELLRLNASITKRVEITPGYTDARCKHCKVIAGRVLTIRQALEEMPLPDPLCDATSFDGRPGFCCCSFAPVIESLQQRD